MNDLNTSRDQDGQELQEEKDEAAATEGGGTGAPPPPIAGALPMHKWHPHTVKVTKMCSCRWELAQQSIFLYLPNCVRNTSFSLKKCSKGFCEPPSQNKPTNI